MLSVYRGLGERRSNMGSRICGGQIAFGLSLGLLLEPYPRFIISVLRWSLEGSRSERELAQYSKARGLRIFQYNI
ncbi:hypothetical protein EVAR_73602_1 [Eumeta japonica]|uniref:Uncharacterized protein n=1 Tax=Eumeta variegata TaxID=151549 RepID=A0A4C1SCL7_EUMVA|nr:hypothetical protein EVAR_73602_1 [Eumeta japonica]